MTKKSKAVGWEKYRYLIVGGLLAALMLVTYSNTLRSGWHFDDYDSIAYNKDMQSWDRFHKRFVEKNRNRVVGYFTFALNYSIHGDDVVGYHVTNIGIHLMSGLIGWRLIVALLSMPKIKPKMKGVSVEMVGLIGLMFFWLHPVQTQAVNYIVQRLASLAAMFYMLAVYLFVKARVSKDPVNRAVLGLLTVVVLMLGMYTKETVYSWPLMFAMIEVVGFRGWKKVKWKHLLGLGLAVGAIVALVLYEYGTNWILKPKMTRLDEVVTSYNYPLTQLRVILKYFQLLVLPVRQNFDYYFPISRSLLEPWVWVGLGFLVSLVYAAIKSYKKRPEITLGVAWMLIGISIESSIFPIEDVIFEHRLYLPMLGFGMMVGAWLYRGFGKKKDQLLLVLMVLAIVMSGLTFLRNRVWATELSLWSDTVKKSPLKPRVQNQVGVHFQKAGNMEKAIYHYQKVLELQPDHADVHYNLGQAMLSLGRYDEALDYFQRAYELNNEITRAFNFIGTIYIQKGEYELALEYIQRAIEGEPGLGKLYKNKGDALVKLGRLEEARVAYRQALRREPNNMLFRRALQSLGSTN